MSDESVTDGGNGTSDETVAHPVQAGKDPNNGRFVAGNKYGRGNPLLRRLAEYRAVFNAAVEPKTLHAVISKMCVRAIKDGDVAAAKLILEYAIGKPEKFDPLAVAEYGPADQAAAIREFLLAAGQTVRHAEKN